MNNHTIATSVIGSYPVFINTMDLMSRYFTQKEIDWNIYISTAVQDITQAGIDIIADGQTRDPFIQLFTRKLKGCRIRDRTEIYEPIEYVQPITVTDQQFVRSLLSPPSQLKGVLTGPYTLTKSCVDLCYHNEKELAFAFAHALHQEAQALLPFVDFISIDEPFFANACPDYAKELLLTITKGLTCPTLLHACGDVAPIIPSLLEMPVDILSHEFKASPHLLNAFKEYSFPHHFCVGAVRSDSIVIEPVQEIVDHVKKAYDLFGDKILQISPDCGQRLLPRTVAYQKLQHLAQAGGIING